MLNDYLDTKMSRLPPYLQYLPAFEATARLGGVRLAAEELNDLIVQSPERERLWQALRERGLAAEKQYERRQGGEIDLALLCALGPLGITLNDAPGQVKERGAWNYLAVSPGEVGEDLPGVVAKIEAEVRRLGGARPQAP